MKVQWRIRYSSRKIKDDKAGRLIKNTKKVIKTSMENQGGKEPTKNVSSSKVYGRCFTKKR